MSAAYEVKLFGPYADAAGEPVVRITLPAGRDPTASELMEMIAEEQPPLRPLMKEARLAVNREFAAPDQTVRTGDDLALIGLVAGG